MFDNDRQAAFFFGEPLKIFARIWAWFVTDADIYRAPVGDAGRDRAGLRHRRGAGLAGGLWLALSPDGQSAILEPYIKALNSMPRIILAPIFAVWFGLGIASKVALGVTLVFFIVFFNVYQGVKEVSPVVLANARMLGANQQAAAAPRVPAQRHQLGVQLACTPAWAWPSWARWWASTWARPGRGLPDPAGRRAVRHQHRDGRHPGADHVCAGARRLRGRIEKRLMKWQPKAGKRRNSDHGGSR
jgi:NitT/TauT family transport system permease protein